MPVRKYPSDCHERLPYGKSPPPRVDVELTLLHPYGSHVFQGPYKDGCPQ